MGTPTESEDAVAPPSGPAPARDSMTDPWHVHVSQELADHTPSCDEEDSGTSGPHCSIRGALDDDDDEEEGYRFEEEKGSDHVLGRGLCGHVTLWLLRVGLRGDREQLERWNALLVRAGESELAQVASLAWPTVLSNVLNFMLSFINLLFVGHLSDGETELAAAALAITFTNVTGLSVGIGLLCAIDTLCSQAYGARRYRQVGLIVQRAVLIITLASLFFAAIWLSSEHIFLLCQLPPKLSALAGRYCTLLVPGVWFYMMADVLRRWLQAQGIVKPVILITIGTVLINLAAQYTFIYVLGMGFEGSPVGLALTWASTPFLLLAYIVASRVHTTTWHGWSWECMRGWGDFLRLALPGTLMVCAEWWGFEVTVLATGLIGEVELAAHTVVFNITGLWYMVPLGMSVAASTRVGNLLGAGEPERAKRAASSCILLTVGAQGCAALLIFTLRNQWGGLYSNDSNVVALVARVLPFAAVLTIFDGTQGVCGGVLRGAGKQAVGAALNLMAFYAIGLPISLVLGFASPLGFFGIWVGLVTGVVVIAACLLTYILRFVDWPKASLVAREKAGVAEVSIEAGPHAHEMHELGTLRDIDHSSLPRPSSGAASELEGPVGRPTLGVFLQSKQPTVDYQAVSMEVDDNDDDDDRAGGPINLSIRLPQQEE